MDHADCNQGCVVAQLGVKAYTDKNENDVILNPRLTSHEIADDIAIQLGGSFTLPHLQSYPQL